MMEMQTPPQAGIPSPMHGDNFTVLEVASTENDGVNAPAKHGSRILLLVAVLIIVLVVIAAIILLSTGGAGLP
jgi:hypothetical protein